MLTSFSFLSGSHDATPPDTVIDALRLSKMRTSAMLRPRPTGLFFNRRAPGAGGEQGPPVSCEGDPGEPSLTPSTWLPAPVSRKRTPLLFRAFAFAAVSIFDPAA